MIVTWRDAMMRLLGQAMGAAQIKNQTVGEDNKYYVTIEQLEALMKPFLELGQD